MRYRNLGGAGVQVSRLALGTMNFGPRTPEDEAHAVMSRALELGVNFFDTADIYGGRIGEGITEQIIGRWLAADPARREQIVLATKVYGPMGRTPNSARLSALHIRRACEASLRRLRTDHLDLFQLHHIDRTTPWEEIWTALELLVAQGKVIYVGSSNFAGWHLARAQEVARRRGSQGLVSEQSVYNLLERSVEREVLPACAEYGIGLLPYSPLQGGLLAGVLRRGDEAGRSTEPKARRQLERHRERIAAYESWCAELGEDPASVGLAWLLHRPGVTAPVVGPRTVGQLEGAMRALRVSLDDTQLKELDAIFPGPGGPAPEAYAW
ncbi:aldo/keto reductase [Kitasatospora sp. NPDC050543]|uniref:aldo/keto reductase n=1 Tax=Kitasatospora sp. NPDC050543 TaxID=3364054 RepID=UPI00378E2592